MLENCQVTLGNVRWGSGSSGLQVMHLGKMAEKLLKAGIVWFCC